MITLVLLLEEPSAKDLLEGLLPRLLPAGVLFKYLVFEGKQDLENQLARKIRGWRLPDSRFVILRDQDAANCADVKGRLRGRLIGTGCDDVLIRVACREIEAWLLGDWKAVAAAFDKPPLANQARKAIYRDPDILAHPVEELRKFIPEYQKRDGARRIGTLLDLDPSHNSSKSFQVFCAGIRKLVI